MTVETRDNWTPSNTVRQLIEGHDRTARSSGTFEVMAWEVMRGQWAPLADWLVDHPEDYRALCCLVNEFTRRLERYQYEAPRPVHAPCPEEWWLDQIWRRLVPVRDRAASMLGYVAVPLPEWEEDPCFDPNLLPREDRFGFPLAEDEIEWIDDSEDLLPAPPY